MRERPEVVAPRPDSESWSEELVDQLLHRARLAPSPTPDRLAHAVKKLGREASLGIDRFFDSGKGSEPGPIAVVDLFSGCGGMSAGFVAANGVLPAFRLVGAADIDPVANESYALNLGVQPALGDIKAMADAPDDSEFLQGIQTARGDSPLVLIGCAPCQGFSSHRNSSGSGDSRNSLFEDFVTVALWLNPDVIVVENVPELLTTQYWPHVQSARERLETAGYNVTVSVHNMAEFGVPQERFRAVLLASRRTPGTPKGFLERPSFRTVRDAIGDLPPLVPGQPDPSDSLHCTAGHRASTVSTIRSIPHDGGSRPAWEGPPSLQRVAKRQGKPAYEDVYGRLWWDRPSITVTAYARNPASGRYCHPEQDRGLSIREGALLQGFPRTYGLAGTLDPCFRQVGNAVPPRFSAALAMHVLGILLGAAAPVGMDVRAPLGASFSRLIPALKAGSRVLPDASPAAS